MSEAFLTGSHAYGEPKKGSDVDLVIRVSSVVADKLKELSGGKEPVRFGNLNLILCETDTEFAAWKVGTVQMSLEKTRGSQEDDRDA